MKKVKCPDCGGDGIETCHNPDHGFIEGVLPASNWSADEQACPCCGHDPNHKMKGICETCNGSGVATLADAEEFMNEEGYDFELEFIN